MIFEKGDKVRVKSWKIIKKGFKEDEDFFHSEDNYESIKEMCKKEFKIYKPDEYGVMIHGVSFTSEDLQLILESPKLSLRLSQKGLTLKVKILHQDESLFNNLKICDHNYVVCSRSHPVLNDGVELYLKGAEYMGKNTDKISYTYSSQSELDSFVSTLRIMMKDDKLK